MDLYGSDLLEMPTHPTSLTCDVVERTAADDLLRELAFVLYAARKVRRAMQASHQPLGA